MTSNEINRLLAEIATAADESEIAALTLRSADAIAGLPEPERERVNEQIADAVREHRTMSQDNRPKLANRQLVLSADSNTPN
jgi:hypothetical protein